MLFSCAALHANDDPRRILLLHAYNFTNPSSATIADAVRRRLHENGSYKVELGAEFLDLARASDPEHEPRMAAFLRDKYARAKPDLIIVVGDALRFVITHRAVFAPTIPVVFAGISPESFASLQPPSDVTGALFDIEQHLHNTISLAERLQPDARHLFVVAGSGSLDRRWQATARRVIESRNRRFETTYVFERSYDAAINEISRVPPDSIVVLLTFFEDATGKAFSPVNVANALIKVSPAPTYAPYLTRLAFPLVGGAGESFETMGAVAADMAQEILSGKDPRTIPARSSHEQSYRVDHKAMKHWGLSEQNLPSGTTVLFKEPGIWDEHRNLLLAIFAILALQSIVVAFLLMERRWRHHAETQLGESEERMTFTAAAVNVGLWQFDPQTREFWATEHCRAMFGYAPDAPFTRDTFVNAIHPEDRDATVTTLRGITKTGLQASTDVRIIRPDGEIRWVRIRARALTRAGRTIRQLSGTLNDITENKTAEAEAALQRQEVAHLMRVSVLGGLSGAIAHEINQPLTAILANAQAALHLLPEDAPNMSEVRDALHDIVDEDNGAGHVIQRLRNLLKKGDTTSEPVAFNQLVNSTIALLNGELMGRGIAVQADLATDLPFASGDPVQLQQVLINLIINAADAMASTPVSQKQIAISTCATGVGTLEVLVRDRGTGLSETEPGKLFEPFHTTKQQGLGLGLTICSTIVQAHGGNLSLTNRVGGGAEARFSLPAHELLIAAQ